MKASQQVLNLIHKPTYGLDDFFRSSSNNMAFSWIESWPSWPNHCLILYGPEGSGKTHLAEIWRTRAGGKRLLQKDLRRLNLDEVCQTHKALVVEDIGADPDEESLFHLYNAVRQAGGYLLLTSDKSPNDWNLQLPDLRSRIHAATWAEIEPADDDLLRAMMRKVFSDEQVLVSDAVLNYLLNHHDRSFAGLQEAVHKINSFAMATKRRITLPLVKQVLK